jgi:hypothetical protein
MKLFCKNCGYWREFDYDDQFGESSGFCDRFPPLHFNGRSGESHDPFCWRSPLTHERDWCGEHKKKDQVIRDDLWKEPKE